MDEGARHNQPSPGGLHLKEEEEEISKNMVRKNTPEFTNKT
jgi:hypothetical protein